jgi:hypothetical protein
MCSVSNTIREKPNWWIKIQDLEIMKKWRAEIASQQESQPEEQRLSDEMVCSKLHTHRLI